MYKEKFLDHTNSEEAGIRVFAQTGLSGERIVKAELQGGGEGVFLPPANQKAWRHETDQSEGWDDTYCQ